MEFEVIDRRAAGNTTRQVDSAIQILFAGLEYKAEDHYQNGKNEHANRELITRIVKRMKYEHPHVQYVIDQSALSIRLT